MQGGSNRPTRPIWTLVPDGATMAEFTLQQHIAAPRQVVWSILADYGNIDAWSTGVAASQIVDGPERGVGAERHCDFAGGKGHVTERVTDWWEGDGFRLVFTHMPGPVKDAHATFRTRDDRAGTRVTLRMGFKGKGPAMLMVPLMVPMMKKNMLGMLADLKRHSEGRAQGAVREAGPMTA